MKNKLIALLSMALFFACSSNTKESAVSEEELNPKNRTEKKMKILLVLTSHDELGDTGQKTGFWLEEFVGPYYYLIDRGVEVTLASPKGGRPPIDPKSELSDFQTESTRRFNDDKITQEVLSKTVKLESVAQEDFDAIFYSGGYGPMWDLTDNQTSITLIESFYNNNKPVASVCHAPAIFKNTKGPDGNSLIKGKKVTAYSNSEEAAVDFTEIVPFSVEDMLQENGGIYSKGPDWGAYAQEDGLLITGQNPASAELVAELLLKKLNYANV
ncbi:MAG: type 1 glutamine amidotransferase domain-containing protein [Bacteroidota bacterium]